jgi:hypothetical protein
MPSLRPAARHTSRATPSPAARTKIVQRQTAEGLPVHSFDTLLAALGTRCAHTCRLRSDQAGKPLRQLAPPSPPLQARALALLGV